MPRSANNSKKPPVLEKLIESINFTSKNSDITEEHFPRSAQSPGSSESVEQAPERIASTTEILVALDHLGLLPGTAQQLALYAKDNDTAGLSWPVVALGSVWVDPLSSSRVVALYGKSGGRAIDLYRTSTMWSAHCRFLAYAK